MPFSTGRGGRLTGSNCSALPPRAAMTGPSSPKHTWGAGGQAVPRERCWSEIQDAMSCGRLHSTDSSGTCPQHHATALGSGQPRERYFGRAASSSCFAWTFLSFVPFMEGCGTVLLQRPGQRRVWLKGTSIQLEEERAVGMRIIFFGGDRAGETQQPAKQLTQPAFLAALSCLTSPLSTWLKFRQNTGGKSQRLDECVARIQGATLH